MSDTEVSDGIVRVRVENGGKVCIRTEVCESDMIETSYVVWR